MAQWWDEWQLRILVLASLAAQYLHTLLACYHKFHIPSWLRVSVRLAHIGSDPLALFALAVLFNRQKNGPRCSYGHGNRDLELLWAPILVMHLGGQVVMATYKLEVSDQWSRPILTSLSKVAVALYVFYKSWSSDDKRLLAATVLLFLLVIVRLFRKAQNLKSSSFNDLRKGKKRKENWSEVGRGFRLRIEKETAVEKMGDSEVGNAIEVVFGRGDSPYREAEIRSLLCHLFLDFSSPSDVRLAIAREFWSIGRESAYQAIEDALSVMFSFLYTQDQSSPYHAFKNAPAVFMFRWCTTALAYAIVITTICLVHTSSHKGAYSGEDTWVTLVLLYGTLVLELVYLVVRTAFVDRFSGRIDQHSLAGSLIYNIRHSRLRRVAGWLQCKELVDEYFWHMEPIYCCREITDLVLEHVKTGWQNNIVDTESYRRFNDTRGELTLRNNGCLPKLGWSLKRQFDESIVLWHLATDFCLHLRATSPDDHCARRCKEMSNYMIYLLFYNPDMLMLGSRKNLFASAYNELEDILKSEKMPQDELEFAYEVFQQCHTNIMGDSFVGEACRLAKSLLDAGGEKMWEVIEGVWVEMLCFSAGWSRGYPHAETLGTGVEYLSYVWVMMAYAGMETFPDKLRRRDGQSVDGDESNHLERKRRRTHSF